MQRISDKGWEGRRTDLGTGGNKDNSNIQIEATNHSNVYGMGIRSNDKRSEVTRQAGGRNYKKGIQKDTGGTAQTTLNEFWKGKEKDMRSWSEEMEELERTEKEIAQNSQES